MPSTSVVKTPITRVEIAEAAKHRKTHVQDLSKYRTEAAEKYQNALQRLANSREESQSTTPIIAGDLVMRTPLNRKSKLYPKWDGPFVILASTDKDVYQLATANGHIINNLVNQARLRKLDETERKRYTGDFWEASKRLRLYDKQAKDQKQPAAGKPGAQSPTDNRPRAQSPRRPVLLDSITVRTRPMSADPTPDLNRRIRRLPVRYRE